MSDNNSHKTDKDLGMNCPITRRDFLNGVALTIGSSMLPTAALAFDDKPFAPEKSAGYYPPALMGMRGNHDGSYTYAHDLRDGDKWNASGAAQSTGETYDLVVVGGGISGLAAAYFYRKNFPGKKSPRILILDNHDDFGGHAKRNEFRVGDRTLLAHGGTMSIEHPKLYSKVAMGLLVDLGIDTNKFYKDFDRTLYSKLGTAMFYDKATFGEDRIVPGMGTTPWPEFLANSPLPEAIRNDIVRVYTEKKNYLPGLTRQQKIARLHKTSYADFLTNICGLNPAALPFFNTYTNDLFAVRIDAVSALDCYQAGDDYHAISFAGFDGLELEEPETGAGKLHYRQTEPYIFHFPDGNASIARLLVRHLIPGSIPGNTMEDVVTARCDYAKLDDAGSPVRLRLNSTAVHVSNIGASQTGDPRTAKEVEIAYDRGGKLQSVRAAHCILACYNVMIPYICPDLPARQKEGLSYLVKSPLVYTHVAL
ncbi:MAG TPA: FAD/NAD(P)-binding protein, partial [Terriglobales bacterium]|nr:FAD/NAD(P)-binding protein [Terriglobales bacterium]